MSLRKLLDDSLSEMHKQYLKPSNFRKNARTFSRDKGSYWERFHIQGSDSNGLYEQWRFYVNVGVEFKDIEPLKYWSHFANTHWATRLESIVPTAPDRWFYNQDTERAELIRNLTKYILQASEKISTDIERIKSNYVEERKLNR